MFENKKVKYISRWGANYSCEVFACEEEVGITLLQVNNEKIIFCLNGPLSPHFKKRDWNSYELNHFHKMFDNTVKMIRETGVIDGRKLPWSKEEQSSLFSFPPTCAFS